MFLTSTVFAAALAVRTKTADGGSPTAWLVVGRMATRTGAAGWLACHARRRCRDEDL